MVVSRRDFLHRSGQALLGASLVGGLTGCSDPRIPTADELVVLPGELFFGISLAEWSLHRTIWYEGLDHLDFAATARRDFGIHAVEYVSQFFSDRVKDQAYLSEMKTRADDAGVRSLLIMVDMQGNLVARDAADRNRALETHYGWVEAAQVLGCHSIRVNLPGKGSAEEVADYAVESLGTLSEFAAPMGINIIVEPHGGYSSNGAWLADVMQRVNMENCGTLPDFGNFIMNLFPYQRYNAYQGVRELMPFAKGVSAKAHRFDENGNEPHIDFYQMMQIVKDAGFQGYVGIEYEGSQLTEYDGIRATMRLLIEAGRAAN